VLSLWVLHGPSPSGQAWYFLILKHADVQHEKLPIQIIPVVLNCFLWSCDFYNHLVYWWSCMKVISTPVTHNEREREREYERKRLVV